MGGHFKHFLEHDVLPAKAGTHVVSAFCLDDMGPSLRWGGGTGLIRPI